VGFQSRVILTKKPQYHVQLQTAEPDMSTVQMEVSISAVRKGPVTEGKTFATGERKNDMGKQQLLPIHPLAVTLVSGGRRGAMPSRLEKESEIWFVHRRVLDAPIYSTEIAIGSV